MSSVLPSLLSGRRRILLASLAGLGLVQAAISVLVAVLTPRLLAAGSGAWGLAASLLGAALLVGAARIGERVLAEDLGQDYVRETRRLLLTSALVPAGSTSLGTTIARTTNDLTAVRNWIALGVSPLVVGVPLILGTVGGLFVLLPPLGLAAASVLAVHFLALWLLSRVFYRRAVAVRRVRGRMAGHVADTVTAAEAIRTSGGVKREVGRVDRISERMQEAAHRRAVVSGAMRGSAASITTLLGVLVAVVGGVVGATGAEVTTAVFIAGMLGPPVTELGRVGEYRQNFNAAARIIGPVIENAREHERRERRRKRERDRLRHHGDQPGLTRGAVHVADLRDAEGTVPDLVAMPGSRVLLTGASPQRIDWVCREITGDVADSTAWVTVAGRHLHAMPTRHRRALVGVAARDVPLPRGSIDRTVRYRVPGDDETTHALLERVGMAERVDRLPQGRRTTLRRGGEPLSGGERALLKLARAVADDPPLLVLDHIEDPLDAEDREVLAGILRDYPGCVILRSTHPEQLLDHYDVWNVDELSRTRVCALPRSGTDTHGLRPTTWLAGSGRDPSGPPVHHSAAQLAGLRHAAVNDRPDDEDDDA